MTRLPSDVIKAIERQAPKLLKKPFNKEFKKKFEDLKAKMIKEFLSHPVTMEIKSGPSATNMSGTLNGVTNLFAFIGFDQGDQPIQPILQILEAINYTYASEAKIGVTYTVNIPEAKEIFAVTPLPYVGGRSWAKGIETGISGLGYLLRKNSGRSGAAIQSRNQVRTGRFQNTPYISALINKYKKEFKELK